MKNAAILRRKCKVCLSPLSQHEQVVCGACLRETASYWQSHFDKVISRTEVARRRAYLTR